MIELRELTRRFAARGRTVEAVSGISLEIPAGGVWAVVGPNGAGKTTLFALVLGFLRPTAGSVRVRGLEPRRYARRHGVAYLPERFRLPAEWPVRHALRALARLEGLGRAAATRRADELLERFGLAEHAEKEAGQLSRGLLQRLGLAQALLAERELVVLDEPTEGLDPLWRVRFRALVEGLRAEGRTVLLASHDLAEVERLADRVVLLDAGRVRAVLDARPAPGPRARYRIELAEPVPALAEIFPDAAPVEGAAAAYLVDVADARELSARLAALLDAGAVLVSAAPAAEPLEARVQRALTGENAP